MEPRDIFHHRAWLMSMTRGLAAVALGFLLVAWSSASVSAVMTAFGSYAVFAGAAWETESIMALRCRKSWSFQISLAVVSMIVGILSLSKPEMSDHAALYLASAWMVAVGAVNMAWGSEIAPTLPAGRLKTLTGSLSIAAGFILMLFPDVSVRVTAETLGGLSLISGAVESAFALLLRGALRE